MQYKYVKTLLAYALMLCAGAAAGYGLSRVPAMLKPQYTQGDFSRYFPNRQTQVVLYGTTWCQFCAKARVYFQENKIPFADIDIEQSVQGKLDHLSLGGGGVPLILVGKRRIDGYKPDALTSALAALPPP